MRTIPRYREPPVASTISDFKDFLTHPVKISHTSWDGTTADANLTKNLVLFYVAALPTSMAKKLANMFYFRAKLKITIVVQGAAQAYGQMNFAFTPNVNLPFEGSNVNTLTVAKHNCRIVPHITIDPSKNNTYEIVLPMVSPTGFYQVLNDSLNHGSYRADMFVINKIRSGTAVAPTVNVCVYMSLVDPQFEGLTLLTSNDFEQEKVSDVVGSVSYLSAMVAPFTGVFEPGVMLFSEVAGVASKVLRWFGFSKPPQADIHAFVLNRTCDNYTQIEGVSSSLVLGCSQKQSVAIDPAFGAGKMEDMAISTILAKPALIAIDKSFDSTSTGETFLFSLPVHPQVSLSNTAPSTTSGIACVAAYWCGDLTYLIEFIASPFTRATVLIAWDPFATATTAPSFGDALTILQNTTVQIVGNTIVELTIPYKHYMPVLSTVLVTNGPQPITSAGATGSSNGMLYFFVVNPSVDNSGTAAVVPINIWQFSNNCSFFCSTSENIPIGPPVTTTLTASDFVDEMAPPAKISFGPKTDLTNLHKRVTGDALRSVKDVASRMDAVWTGTAGGTAHENGYFQHFNMPFSRNDQWLPFSQTRLGWIATAYLGFRGSVRWSATAYDPIVTTSIPNGRMEATAIHTVATADTGPITAAVASGPVAPYPYSSYAWTQANLNVSSRVDVAAPIIIGADYLPLRVYPATWKDNIQFSFDLANISNAGNMTFSLGQAAGDDAVFIWFLGFPVI